MNIPIVNLISFVNLLADANPHVGGFLPFEFQLPKSYPVWATSVEEPEMKLILVLNVVTLLMIPTHFTKRVIVDRHSVDSCFRSLSS